VEARVVLANGSAVTASASSYSDLFWALKGAGHNFGIVSEFRQRIYNSEPQEQWVVTETFFAHDKLEALVQIMNSLTDHGKNPYPVGLTTFLGFVRSPESDLKNVSICLCATKKLYQLTQTRLSFAYC
jgi:FAD/FMN-containing dehydrogenase